jgi:surface protein
MKISKFDSNERPINNSTKSSDEEVGESQLGPSLEMLEFESLLEKNNRTKILAGENPVKEPKLLVHDEEFWHQRKVPWRALIMCLAVAVVVSVAVMNAVTGKTSEPSTVSEPSCNCIFAGKCFDTTSELREAVDLYLVDNRSNSSVASTYGWPIGDWCVSNIHDFSELFSPHRYNLDVHFNEDISRWDVSNAKTMRSMFAGSYDGRTGDATSRFNQSLADWDVSSVTDMSSMFHYAYSFDRPLGGWNVSSVTDMSNMFYNARSFNQPLANWDVSSVTDMDRLFFEAKAFNQPLADWDVSRVTEMSYMFAAAFAFNQSLGDWNVSSVATMRYIFERSGCPGKLEQECCFDDCS